MSSFILLYKAGHIPIVTIAAQLFLEKLNNHQAFMIEISSPDQRG